ncbi:MAG: hypothetical protein U0236_21060 [Nitrospira sp.]
MAHKPNDLDIFNPACFIAWANGPVAGESVSPDPVSLDPQSRHLCGLLMGLFDLVPRTDL